MAINRQQLDSLMALAGFGNTFNFDQTEKAKVADGIAYLKAHEDEALELEPLLEKLQGIYEHAQPQLVAPNADPVATWLNVAQQSWPTVKQIMAVLKKYGQ